MDGAAAPRAGAAPSASTPVLWQAMQLVWGYLQQPYMFDDDGVSCAAALRAACREGRLLHDTLLCNLRLKLRPPSLSEGEIPAPDPEHVKGMVSSLLQRGKPLLRALTIRATVPREALAEGVPWELTAGQEDEWTLLQEQRCLAVFEALKLSPCPGLLTCLEIDVGPWLTANVGSALAEACPSLSKLVLKGNARPNAATEFGVLQLYGAVGRGLRSLHLRRLVEWRPVLLHGLRLCTGLEELEVDIKQSSDDPFEDDLAVMRAITQLTSLQSLRLFHDGSSNTLLTSIDAIAMHATDLTRLSALTGLTQLRLALGHCTYGDPSLPNDDMLRNAAQAAADAQRLREAYGQQQAALSSALRRMPNLSTLVLAGLPLCTETLTALTSLTHVVASRLALPTDQPTAATAPSLMYLPPRLESLWFPQPQKLSVLSRLALPPELHVLFGEYQVTRAGTCVEFMFGREDMDPAEWRLLPAAVDRLKATVPRLAAHRSCQPSGSGALRLCAEAGPGTQLLLPPQPGAAGGGAAAGGSAMGHAVWIRELGPVRRPVVALRGLELVGSDLECLAAMLPEMKVLALRNCSFDFFELSDALSHHAHLRHVVLCPGRSRYTVGDVARALLQLCQRAPSVRRVTLLHTDGAAPGLRWDSPHCELVCDLVARGLEEAGMGDKVQLEVEDGSAETGLREEFELVRAEEWGREE